MRRVAPFPPSTLLEGVFLPYRDYTDSHGLVGSDYLFPKTGNISRNAIKIRPIAAIGYRISENNISGLAYVFDR